MEHLRKDVIWGAPFSPVLATYHIREYYGVYKTNLVSLWTFCLEIGFLKMLLMGKSLYTVGN